MGLGVAVRGGGVHIRECERPRAARDLTVFVLLVVLLAVPSIGHNGVWTVTRTIHFHALTIVSVFGCGLSLALS